MACMAPDLVLRPPRPDEQDEFLRAHRATTPNVPNSRNNNEAGLDSARNIG